MLLIPPPIFVAGETYKKARQHIAAELFLNILLDEDILILLSSCVIALFMPKNRNFAL